MTAGTATTVAAAAAAAPAASAQGQPVAVVDAARIAVAAARAVLLEAIVQGRAADGVVTLKTQQGTVQIRSTTPLPTGATVALELMRNGDQLSARLFTAATLRGPPTIAVPAAQTQAPSGATTANAATGSAPTTATPAPRPESIGGGTFGAVALAPDPAMPPRAGTAPAPTTASPTTPAPAPAPAVHPAGDEPAPAVAPRGAVAGAAPAPAPPSTLPGTTVSAAPTGAMAPRPAAPSVQVPTAQASAAPAAVPTTASASSPATSIADPPLTTRAAAVAIYAQARPAPASRLSTPVTSTAIAAAQGIRPEGDMPQGTRAPVSGNAGGGQPASPTLATPQRLQPGTTLEVRMASATPQPANPGTRPAQPLPATVVGAMPQGRLVVDTPVGRLAVSVPPDLLGTPPGATLSLEWLPESSRAPVPGDAPGHNAQSTRNWPQTREAAAALLARSEPTAREAADQLVPKPGPRLAQQMMGFIGRGDGDVARWLGEAVLRQLEQLGMRDPIGRTDGAAREPDRQPANGDWRHVTMPLFDGTLLRPIEIRARRRNGGQAEGGRDQSRFVVDCVHDDLGAVQIDGLMTATSAKKRLDVILRSHVELPEADRIALGTLFADTCGAMGLGGEIAFQVLEHFPVVADNPLAHRAVIA